MAETKGYQGWTNYETWNVALWTDNEQGSYSYWREQAREMYRATEATRTFTRAESAARKLADQLREEIEEGNPLSDQPGLYSDILGAALSEVNCHEIAGNWIDEVAEDIDQEEQQDADEED